jgi:hypothetical protein
MSQPKTSRTSIEDLSAFGEELSEDNLRLALGGFALGGSKDNLRLALGGLRVIVSATRVRKTYDDEEGVCKTDQGLDEPGQDN